jgi:hypothetical protein
MNTKCLAKHYDKLTPWERVPLIIAAGARSDEAELERLARSAPMSLYRVSNFHGLSDGLHASAGYHMMAQLDLAALYWHLYSVLAENSLCHNKNEAKQFEDRIWKTIRLLAYRFVFCADVWCRLCSELGIDPHALLRDCPGFDTITTLEEQARTIAFSAEAAAEQIRQRDSQAQVSTIEDTVRAMREALQQCARSWM